MNKPSIFPHLGLMWALLAGIVIASLLMLRNVTAHEATPVASETSTVLIDRGCAPIETCRTQHGNIFFGRVVDVVETSKGTGSYPCPESSIPWMSSDRCGSLWPEAQKAARQRDVSGFRSLAWTLKSETRGLQLHSQWVSAIFSSPD